MKEKTKRKTRTTKREKQTPAEALHGVKWVERQWKAAQGLLKGKNPKDPIAWQRKIRKEWHST